MQSKVLIDFFSGYRVHPRRMTIEEILAKDDDWIERTHDVIQWLFPTTQQGKTKDAPILDNEVILLFKSNPLIIKNYLLAFKRMLLFFGLEEQDDKIIKGKNWDTKKQRWFLKPTHNNLRITRILTSLHTNGQEIKAEKLFCFLKSAYKDEECKVGSESYEFWNNYKGTKQ